MGRRITTTGRIIKAAALPLLLLLAAVVTIKYGEYISTDFIRQQHATVQSYYQANQSLTIALFTLLGILYIGAAIPGGQLVPIAAGLFFGYLIGFIASALCYAVGPMLTFFISRYCLGNYLQQRYADKLKSFNEGFEKNGIWYLFILRQLPVPFFLANLCLGLTTMSAGKYFWGNSLSLLPNTILGPYLGTLLAKVRDYNDLVSPELLLAAALIVVAPLLAAKLIFHQARRRQKQSR